MRSSCKKYAKISKWEQMDLRPCNRHFSLDISIVMNSLITSGLILIFMVSPAGIGPLLVFGHAYFHI